MNTKYDIFDVIATIIIISYLDKLCEWVIMNESRYLDGGEDNLRLSSHPMRYRSHRKRSIMYQTTRIMVVIILIEISWILAIIIGSFLGGRWSL